MIDMKFLHIFCLVVFISLDNFDFVSIIFVL